MCIRDRVTLVHNFPVVCTVDPIDLHGVRLVHQIKKGRKTITEGHAAAAAVAVIKDPSEFCVKLLFITEPGFSPVNRVPCRGIQTAFTMFRHSLTRCYRA